MTAREGRALGNPGTRLPLIGFSEKKKTNKQKTIKLFLSCPIKFARERVNVRHVSHVSGFSPGKISVVVKTPGRFSKQHLHDYLGGITEFSNFTIIH